MPIDPIKFLGVAGELKDHQSEEYRRTSVNRSYYAVFLYFRDYLNRTGVSKDNQSKHDIHEFVIQCLSYSNTRPGSIVGQKLNDLRQYRNHSDYEINNIFLCDSSSVHKIAQGIITDFNRDINQQVEDALIQAATKHAQLKGWIISTK
jgi:uncharacterized protein (UPF0332 family)